jgi:hypothetical protein
LCGWVLRHQQPLFFAQDGDHYDDLPAWRAGQASALLAPIFAQNRIIGGLTASGRQGGGSFRHDEFERLCLIANQVGIAIENARLLDDAERWALTLEQRVKERTMELEISNRELEAFSYSVSHDLRAPLRHINGYCEWLLHECAPPLAEDAQAMVQRMSAASSKMAGLINALLSLARISRTPMSRRLVDLSAMAEEIINELRLDEPQRNVVCQIEKNLSVNGDTALLRVVLYNLFSNAWKYSRGRASARISFGTRIENERRYFCVEDNGAGFDSRYCDKLFQPFQRLHTAEQFEGLGIGLATVHRIVQRHGGDLCVSSEPDRGARFCFCLDN